MLLDNGFYRGRKVSLRSDVWVGMESEGWTGFFPSSPESWVKGGKWKCQWFSPVQLYAMPQTIAYTEHLKQRHHFADKGPSSGSYDFSSSHVRMWELDHKEGWVPRNWWFWTVVLEKTLESPLECKEIKSVSHKENQTWIFIGRTDAEAEAPIHWLPDAKSQFLEKLGKIGKDAGKEWGQEEKEMTEDEMVG